ncbi:helix-turn-helix domain-containing protein [Nostoc sp. FACHB-888]|nr:helix-turn-helix domain-containing protein [Nostoc sp. FACHB-888]
MTQRILILLLMDDGKTYQEISEFLGCGYRTVAYWLVCTWRSRQYRIIAR